MKAGFWRGKSVFISGVNGFVGAWLARRLVAEGARVTGLVRDLRPSSSLKVLGVEGDVTVVRGSLLDFEVVERALNEYEVDTCFHLAAQALVGIANRSPRSTFQSNIAGTWNLLDACRQSPAIKRVVVASSDKAYGSHRTLPYDEDFPLLGLNPYDASKACTDILARTYHKSFGLPVAVTRCANIYGGADLDLSRIVPGTAVSVLKGQPVVLRSDGSPIRDYLYVEDAVNAYLLLASQLDRAEVRGQAFNFGTGQPTSVRDLVSTIVSLSGRVGARIEMAEPGHLRGEIDAQWLSSQKAERVLSWSCHWSIDRGLRQTIDWYSSHLALF